MKKPIMITTCVHGHRVVIEPAGDSGIYGSAADFCEVCDTGQIVKREHAVIIKTEISERRVT